MSNPDIIVPLTQRANGPEAWVYVDSIVIDRDGAKPLVTPYGTEDTWRIASSVRASLAEGGEAMLDPSDKEIPTNVPAPYGSKIVDVADIAHDPRVLQAVALLRSVLLDLHTGVLVPA